MARGVIDADSIAYRAAAAAESREWLVYPDEDSEHAIASFQYKKEAKEWAELHDIASPKLELTITPQPVENAFHNISNIIKGIVEKLQLDSYHLYLSSSLNFRDDIATIREYKGNRANLRKPHHLSACRNFLIKNFDAEVCEGYEADDAASMDAYADPDLTIVSIDKDLDMVPGKHYDWVNELEYDITEDEGRYNFYFQLLMGDTTDNIQGITGCGKAKAKDILQDSENYMCDVGMAYALSSYEDPEAALIENARLLWMAKQSPDDWSWNVV